MNPIFKLDVILNRSLGQIVSLNLEHASVGFVFQDCVDIVDKLLVVVETLFWTCHVNVVVISDSVVE